MPAIAPIEDLKAAREEGLSIYAILYAGVCERERRVNGIDLTPNPFTDRKLPDTLNPTKIEKDPHVL